MIMANEVGPAPEKAGNKTGTPMPLAAIGFRCADSMKARRLTLRQKAEYTTATDSLLAAITTSVSAYLREESIYVLFGELPLPHTLAHWRGLVELLA